MIHFLKLILKKSLILLFISFILLANPNVSNAHFVEVYSQINSIQVNRDGIVVYCYYCTGPIYAPIVWIKADMDADGKISPREARQWIEKAVSHMSGLLDEKTKIAWEMEDLKWPSSINLCSLGDEDICVTLKFPWPKNFSGAHRFVLEDSFEEQICTVYFDVFNANKNNQADLKNFNFQRDNRKLSINFNINLDEGGIEKSRLLDQNKDFPQVPSSKKESSSLPSGKNSSENPGQKVQVLPYTNQQKSLVPTLKIPLGTPPSSSEPMDAAAVDASPQNQLSINEKIRDSLNEFRGAKGNPSATKDMLQQKQSFKILSGILDGNNHSLGLYLLFFFIAFLLGALHALTPGHGKSLVAAYLVGSKGTLRHAVILGAIVTLTHTGSVIILSMITLTASHFFLPQDIFPFLEIGSGLLVFLLGIVLFRRRLKEMGRGGHLHHSHHPHGTHSHDHQLLHSHDQEHPHSPDLEHPHSHDHEQPHSHDHKHPHSHDHKHPHSHDHSHPHTHNHSHALEEFTSAGLSMKSLITLGISGGMLPCPDAIAILLVAITLNKILLGTLLILNFSFGIAFVIIAIGIIIVKGRTLVSKVDGFEAIAPILSVLSSLVVLVLGGILTFKAAENFDLLTKVLKLISKLGNVFLSSP